MKELSLVPEKVNAPRTKVIKGIASITFEIEVPIGVNINPWDIKVNAGKGWCKLHTAKAKKAKKTVQFEAGEETKDIFDD